MADKDTMKPQLWTERPVEETIAVYRDWAESYDADVGEKGYATPDRIADALSRFLRGEGPVLDFGCGTGISGAALARAGIGPLHGCDVTGEMIAIAEGKQLYDRLWVSEPGAIPADPGTYRAIVAAGVVSLGAAPPETLDDLLAALDPGGLLALSFNDPTLENGRYDARLDGHVAAGRAEVLFREHGPHLADMEMGSDVLVLRRT